MEHAGVRLWAVHESGTGSWTVAYNTGKGLVVTWQPLRQTLHLGKCHYLGNKKEATGVGAGPAEFREHKPSANQGK